MKRKRQLIVLLMAVTGALLACKKEKEEKQKVVRKDSIETRSPTKNLPWKDDDFGNTKLDHEDTGIDACDAILNACFNCRNRVESVEGDDRLWGALTARCIKYRGAFKKLASDQAAMKTRCEAAMKEMKAAPDCVRSSAKAAKSLEAP